MRIIVEWWWTIQNSVHEHLLRKVREAFIKDFSIPTFRYYRRLKFHMCNDTHLYGASGNLYPWTHNDFSFTGVKLNYGVKMEQVEYQAVIRFLYLKGHTLEEKLLMGRMPHHMTLLNTGITSSRVETDSIPEWPQSAIDENTVSQVEVAILEDCHMTVRHLAQDAKISMGSVDKIIPDHLQCISCLQDGFPGCSHLFRNRNE